MKTPGEEINPKKLLNEDVSNNAGKIRQQCESAQPFRHIAIGDFLESGSARSLLDSFPAFDEKLAMNENGVAYGISGKPAATIEWE